MNSKELIKVENYFEFFLISFLLIIFIWLIKGFLMSIFLASIFVFLTYNFHKKLSLKIKSDAISALFLLFLVLSVILLPVYMVSLSLINESSIIFNSANNIFENINIETCNFKYCKNILSNFGVIDLNINKIIRDLSLYFASFSSQIFSSISNFVLDFFIFVLSFFFLLKDGDKFLIYVKRLIPMKSEYKRALFIRFRDVSEAVFFNDILVAIIQGALVALGFFIFGIPAPIFWGFVGAFFALLPMFGTAIVWVPVAIYMFLTKDLLFFIGFLAYFIIIVSFSDNFLRPLLLKKRINVHSFVILISVLGGIEIFGFFGIFIGPIIVSLLISIIQLYNLDFN